MSSAVRGNSSYWDGVAGAVTEYYLPPSLAGYKSRQYLDLIGRWGMSAKESVLITDIYEAAFGDPALFARTAQAGELWAIDISPAICRTGRERLAGMGIKAGVVCCDSRALPFKPDCLDLIISPSTFDHFPELGIALDECRRTLRPDGRLLLTLNSADNPLFRPGIRLAEIFKKKEYETGYFYSAKQIGLLLSRAGLKTGRQTALMHVPLGVTTFIQWLDRRPAGRWLSGMIIEMLRLADRAPEKLKLFTGWWVASEGVKSTDQ